MTKTLRALFAAGLMALSCSIATAKLPPPAPLPDEQKAAADAAKAQAAEAAEAAKVQQAKAEDRVAARYIAEQKAKGKVVTPQMGPMVVAAASPAKAPAAPAGKAPATAATTAVAPAKK